MATLWYMFLSIFNTPQLLDLYSWGGSLLLKGIFWLLQCFCFRCCCCFTFLLVLISGLITVQLIILCHMASITFWIGLMKEHGIHWEGLLEELWVWKIQCSALKKSFFFPDFTLRILYHSFTLRSLFFFFMAF